MRAHFSFSEVRYLPGMTMQEYLDECRTRHPSLYERIDIDRLDPAELAKIYDDLEAFESPFDDKEHGGRGDAYRKTQIAYPLVRAQGISRLCQLATPPDATSGPYTYLLDALGGNGTISRAIRLLNPIRSTPTIFTGDISSAMIIDALSQGLPAVRQSIQRWLLNDATIDGVIFAYGTHHIPIDNRPQALTEAHRVLRPGGRIVIHDFEEGTPTARWYSEVVDRYTYTGHKHEHFTLEEMYELLTGAGFRDVRVHYLYDPCVVVDDTPQAALTGVLDYLVNLFALTKLLPEGTTPDVDSWKKVEAIVRDYSTFSAEECVRYGATLGELTVRPNGRLFSAELPRVALVGTGERE